MKLRYRKVLIGGIFLFIFFVLLDWLIFPSRVPRIESAQMEFLQEHLERKAYRSKSNPLEEEHLLPVQSQLWQWFPGAQGRRRQRTELPQIEAMKETLSVLNENMTAQDDPRLMEVIRKFWLRPPGLGPLVLEEPSLQDFSKGQSAVVDELLNRREQGFFVECGALDGETRSNTLFFERERGWTGLLIETGPLNYRKLVKKNRHAYSTPACLGVHPFPTKMYFHRGQNRGRLIDNKEALEWVRQQAMHIWLMEVQCFPLFSLLTALNQTRVDYFSLDVEGAELEVLQTIPWSRVDIEVLTVEFAHDRQGKGALRTYMEARGYETVTEVTREDGLANDLVFKKQRTEKIPIME